MNEITVVKGIECYEEGGVVYLNLESVARGLGFTTVATSGNEVVRWNRVNQYLRDFGVTDKLGKVDYIPENVFYRLAMKARNEVAERFQAFVADEIIPTIRRTGTYGVPITTGGQIQLLAQGYVELEQRVAEIDKRSVTMDQRLEVLEDTSVVNYQQRRKLKSAGVWAVVKILGGKSSNSYKNSVIRTRAFQFMWHEYREHFELTTYHDTPKVKYEDALKYIEGWEPPTNLRLEIIECNEVRV